MEPTKAQIEEYARKLRREERQETLLVVVEEAVIYSEEMKREDQAHRARLQKREDALRTAIKLAAEAMQSGPVTDEEMEYAERRLRVDRGTR